MPCCWKCAFRPRNTVICPGDATPPILSMIGPPYPLVLLWQGNLRALAQQRAARLGWQPVDAGARGEEEDAPILAPGQVRGQLRQDNASQPFAIWAAHPHAARSGAEYVVVQVDLEAVGHAWVLRRHVQEDRLLVSVPSGRTSNARICLWAESSMYRTDSSGEKSRPFGSAKSSTSKWRVPSGLMRYTPLQGCSFPGMGLVHQSAGRGIPGVLGWMA